MSDLDQRILEPELMEDDVQARAYAGADFSAPDQAFVERFCTLFPDFAEGHLLDLGCGPAGILLRLARARPKLRLTGFDGAEAMLAPGREAVAAAGLGERIALVVGRLPGWGDDGAYDALTSNSLLHHLHRPRQLWSELRRLGKPGAPVLVADLLRPASQDQARSLVATYAGEEPEVLRRDFFHSLCAALRPDEVRPQLEEAGLGCLEVAAISDRHLAVWGRLPRAP